MNSKTFGRLADGREARLYTLANNNGMQVVFSDFGGIITNILLPAQGGELADVVLGHEEFSGYVGDGMYLGALVGRNSNRIANAELRLGGESYPLEKNNGRHNLHGGAMGLSNRMFDVKADGNSAKLSTTIPHMEDGFPGTLDVCVTYKLDDDNALTIEYRAEADRPTVINLTNHSYFNLGGHAGRNVCDHVLTMQAPFYTPNDPECIPTGEVLSVKGTPFDFCTGAELGQALLADHPQIALFGGLDHNFMLQSDGYRRVAVVAEPESGRGMEIFTTLPAVQIYTTNSVPDGQRGKGGAQYSQYQGFCFETQLVPNALNMPWLRSPVYEAGEVYEEVTCFKFFTQLPQD